ncbi:MAG TPA: hypothetical protein VLV78_01285 [Thermoanaerobaculia bacterium]|nr:hypothetical protein [Thermoanaerobaculia bacterium]
MTTFTADAQQLFDRYLQTVRWSVRGVADPEEIERDVREHVASALEPEEQPVSSQTLREVLSRLGDPWQWVAPEDLPVWRRIVMRFSLGPEDWRLAYACFGLTILGMLLMPVGIGIVFLIAAYFLGRATYAMTMDREGTLGPRRWLVYPPLVFFSLAMAMALLLGPVAPILGWGIGERGFEKIFQIPARMSLDAFRIAMAMIAFGSWWIALSGLVAIFTRAAKGLLVPLAGGLRRVHVLWLTGLGAVVLGIGWYTLAAW